MINPNVAIELGYAAAMLSWENIILVFNDSSGQIDDLPFDIRQRRMLRYSLDPLDQFEDKEKYSEDKKKAKRQIALAVKEHVLGSEFQQAEADKIDVGFNIINYEDGTPVKSKIVLEKVESITKNQFLEKSSAPEFNSLFKKSGFSYSRLHFSDEKSEWVKYLEILAEKHFSLRNRPPGTAISVVGASSSLENSSYFEDMCSFISKKIFFKPFKISITNNSTKKSLNNVSAVIELNDEKIYVHGNLPTKPSSSNIFLKNPKQSALVSKLLGDNVKVTRRSGKLCIEAEFDLIRPTETIETKSCFYLASDVEEPEGIIVKIYSHDSETCIKTLNLTFEINERAMTIDDLYSFEAKKSND